MVAEPDIVDDEVYEVEDEREPGHNRIGGKQASAGAGVGHEDLRDACLENSAQSIKAVVFAVGCLWDLDLGHNVMRARELMHEQEANDGSGYVQKVHPDEGKQPGDSAKEDKAKNEHG